MAKVVFPGGAPIIARIYDISYGGMGLLDVPRIDKPWCHVYLTVPQADGLPQQKISLRCKPVYSARMDPGGSSSITGMIVDEATPNGSALLWDYVSSLTAA